MRTIATGTTTLITGASSGIGLSFAQSLAAAGSDLVLVARRRDVLDDIAADLRSRHGRNVTVIAHDLDGPDAAETLVARLDDERIEVDALINNAGLGIHGDLGTSPSRMRRRRSR
ncbi:SDR family NAD(P)-dependent oxidoreductase [Microbacterium testaceum]|uniref:SDR family NAD(P)-dependent oxidoreductase n=1 Tax=Microbacterium testaceum TaxID=2033 RepID=UPI00343339CB